jgi:polar amino acid transport system substrate-binding protein
MARYQLQISATIMPVETYEAGIKSLIERTADVFFGDRSILLEAVAGGSSAGDLVVLERLFTFEPIALTLARGDEDFRLTVDRSLNRTFGSPDFSELYRKWFGIPDETTLVFYQFSVLPE